MTRLVAFSFYCLNTSNSEWPDLYKQHPATSGLNQGAVARGFCTSEFLGYGYHGVLVNIMLLN